MDELRLTAADRDATRSYLLVGDEWDSRTGGISVVNQKLAVALAGNGHHTTCLVLSATETDRAAAADRGVRLVVAESTPAGPNLHLPVLAIVDKPADVVIGHDRITGHIAWLYARVFGRSKLVHVVHTAPAEIEPYKTDGGGRAARIAAREQFTKEVADQADVVAAIGPRLARYTTYLLENGYADVPVLRLDPGLDVEAGAFGIERRIPSRPNVMILGRTGDLELKGLDIAAAAVAGCASTGRLPAPVLFVRGAPEATCEEVRAAILRLTGVARGRVDVRPYSADAGTVRRDLMRASLCVMPSRAEGFGLVAWEALAVGTPVLISDQSGAAELLRELLGDLAEPIILEVTDDLERDARTWANGVARVLNDLPRAYAHARRVQMLLSELLSWSSAAERLDRSLTAPSGVQSTVRGAARTGDTATLEQSRARR